MFLLMETFGQSFKHCKVFSEILLMACINKDVLYIFLIPIFQIIEKSRPDLKRYRCKIMPYRSVKAKKQKMKCLQYIFCFSYELMIFIRKNVCLNLKGILYLVYLRARIYYISLQCYML